MWQTLLIEHGSKFDRAVRNDSFDCRINRDREGERLRLQNKRVEIQLEVKPKLELEKREYYSQLETS